MMSGYALFLQTYGAWGLVIILLLSIRYIYVHTGKILDIKSAKIEELSEKRVKEQSNLFEQRMGEFVSMLEETTKALNATANAQDKVSDMLMRVEALLMRVENGLLKKEIQNGRN